MKYMCKLLGHKWVDLFSHILYKPFRECKRCGEQQWWEDALEEELLLEES